LHRVRRTRPRLKQQRAVGSAQRAVRRAAYWLEKDATEKLGFSVPIYPVIVVWGRFEPKETWLGNMAVVRGDSITDWLQARPADLLRNDRRTAVAAWVKALPHA
jgi:hypothetical protein